MLLVAVVVAFAGMYRAQTCGVVHTVAETQASLDSLRPQSPTCIAGERVEPLRSRMDAVYFSAVTITTVGYGDFVPGRPEARALVLWELATGTLLLAGGYSLLISKLADF